MAYWLLLGAMIAVVTGLLALALTNPQKVRDERPALRKAAVAMWLRILIAGWIFFTLTIFAVPGGLSGEWAWIASQTVAMRVAMWVLLLPWMLSVGAWQLTAPPVVRVGLIVGIAALTFFLALQLIAPKREDS